MIHPQIPNPRYESRIVPGFMYKGEPCTILTVDTKWIKNPSQVLAGQEILPSEEGEPMLRFPGGKQRRHWTGVEETPPQTAIREHLEEVGIPVEEGDLVLVQGDGIGDEKQFNRRTHFQYAYAVLLKDSHFRAGNLKALTAEDNDWPFIVPINKVFESMVAKGSPIEVSRINIPAMRFRFFWGHNHLLRHYPNA